MNDWITNFLICAAIIASVCVVVVFGLSAEQAAWEKDCAALGKHRSEGKVYECRIAAPAHPGEEKEGKGD